MTDKIQKNLWTIVLVFVIITFIIYFAGSSCLAGYCSTHPDECGKKIEGYKDPLDIDHNIGNYYLFGSVGGGPRFQVNNGYGGAGEYIMQEGMSGYTGIYGDSRNAPGWKGADRDCIQGGGPPSYSNQRTPSTWSWSGYHNTPKCGGCGYGSCMCCNQDGRGCPVRFNEYNWP